MKQQATIPYTVKHQCVALKKSGKSILEIYNFYCSVMGNTQTYESFRHTIVRWENKIELDPKFVTDNEIMHNVNLGLGYNMGKATVQYNAQTREIEKVWARIKENEVSHIDRIIEEIKNVKPFELVLEPIEIIDKIDLELPLFDMHFGISDYEYYKPTQTKILNIISSKNRDEILIVIGQDCLHTDNFRGQTASGTLIGEIDLTKAWNDCLKFYSPIIEYGLKHSKKVIIMYSPGNHDESMTWAFVQLIKALYPQCEYDDTLEERKIHMFGRNFVGITHIPVKELDRIFAIEFPLEWGNATTREVHHGHFHTEDTKDKFGVMIRGLSTRNKTDRWHKKHGFVGAHKRFQLFEWTKEELLSIHYV